MDPHEQANNLAIVKELCGLEEWEVFQRFNHELDETTMPHDPNESGSSENDEYKDLRKILNYSEAEALEQQELLNTCIDDICVTEEHRELNMYRALVACQGDFSQIISTLRNLAQRIRAHTPGPLQQCFSRLQPPQLMPVWENLDLTANEKRILESVANFPVASYELYIHKHQKSAETGIKLLTSGINYMEYISPVIWGTQKLWLVFHGKVQLQQCQAPIADKPTHKKCENYVISGNKAGREAQYCSDTCRKRANRR